MAERLADAAPEGGNLTQATFIEFVQRHEDIDAELVDAQETVRSIRRRKKDLRKTIVAVGINLAAFDRQLVDAKRSGEEREAEDAQYRRYMAFRAMPVGYQATMDFDAADAGLAALNEMELQNIEREGFEAGRSGKRRDINRWTPGTEPYQIWDRAWVEGQAQIAESMATDPQANGDARTPRRGRRRRSEAEAPAAEEAEQQPELV